MESVSDEEFNSYKHLYKIDCKVTIVAPNHSDLPRNATGTITKVYENEDCCDIMVQN